MAPAAEPDPEPEAVVPTPKEPEPEPDKPEPTLWQVPLTKCCDGPGASAPPF